MFVVYPIHLKVVSMNIGNIVMAPRAFVSALAHLTIHTQRVLSSGTHTHTHAKWWPKTLSASLNGRRKGLRERLSHSLGARPPRPPQSRATMGAWQRQTKVSRRRGTRIHVQRVCVSTSMDALIQSATRPGQFVGGLTCKHRRQVAHSGPTFEHFSEPR